MFFVGRTRFSLFMPQDPSWQLTKSRDKQDEQAIEAYRAELYDDSRLRMRTEIFLEHTVPALQAAADRSGHTVIHVVSFSQSLPAPYKKQLAEAAKEYPVLHLDERPDGAGGSSLAELARPKVQPGEVFGLYRLDDDDVLPTNFFDLVARLMRPAMVGMLVSLPRGLEAITHKGKVYMVREGYYAMHSLGLMQVCAFSEDGKLCAPEPSPHEKSDRANPVVIDSRSIGYLRFNHASQDHRLAYLSRDGVAASTTADELAAVAARMEHLPAWKDWAMLEQLFPTVAPLVGELPEVLRQPTAPQHSKTYTGVLRVWRRVKRLVSAVLRRLP